jgi:hypothetical protein
MGQRPSISGSKSLGGEAAMAALNIAANTQQDNWLVSQQIGDLSNTRLEINQFNRSRSPKLTQIYLSLRRYEN